ncbi:MAG: hypothetical protein QF406_15155, partial [Verrucomicrobiota bacterium]|nr:hypothetical protein [Verrucomicrobiota bacterium]
HENKGGADYLETYDPPTLLPWQTRFAQPTEYEQELADALQEIFGEEVYDLPVIVGRLNESDVKPPVEEGGWTEANFQSVMKRLGEWP